MDTWRWSSLHWTADATHNPHQMQRKKFGSTLTRSYGRIALELFIPIRMAAAP